MTWTTQQDGGPCRGGLLLGTSVSNAGILMPHPWYEGLDLIWFFPKADLRQMFRAGGFLRDAGNTS